MDNLENDELVNANVTKDVSENSESDISNNAINNVDVGESGTPEINTNNSNSIAIIGIGRVGLPLGLTFSGVGYKIFGIDINGEYVEKIKRKEVPFKDEGLKELIDK
ncbi:MAG: hypothetical protein GWP09_01020 [Nitrospiraceae bacterium]|nr:hypothetical protein [Nitrospiraceae bacterium]